MKTVSQEATAEQEKTQHTAGPWHIEEHKHAPAAIVSTGAHRHIEVGCVFFTDLPSGAANAKLMAAAPDLLDACNAVYRLHAADGFRVSDSNYAVICGLAVAIAKAEGRSL